MKIWIINHFAYGPDQSAGTRHYELAKGLQHKGHDVLIVASSFYHKGRKEARLNPGEFYRREDLYGVPFQWIKTPTYKNNPFARLWNMVVFAWKVYQGRWQKKDEKPDIVIGSSPSLLAALAGLLIARKMGTPFILEIRDVWPDSLKDIGGISHWNPVYIFFKFIEKYLYKNSDHIITLLPNSFEHIVFNGGRQDKISWIPNGVDLSNRPPLPPKDNKDQPFTITYFGAHGPYSGLDNLIDAASLLKESGWNSESIRFVLIGDGSKDRLLYKAKSIGVLDFFEFQTSVPKTDLWECIKESDAFLMIALPISAHKKGISPNKLWEYFAASRPVIFSIEYGENMAQESGGGISAIPGEAESLACSIEQLCAMDEKKREKLGVNGRKYVEANADMPQLVYKLEQLILQVRKKKCNTSQ